MLVQTASIVMDVRYGKDFAVKILGRAMRQNIPAHLSTTDVIAWAEEFVAWNYARTLGRSMNAPTWISEAQP